MDNDVLSVQQSLGIVGKSPLLQRAISVAIQAAPYDANVLVIGENGVGKESFYKILHNYSGRRHKKCIPVNCGALPEGTINSELFGHVKGAFTGAIADRKGFFEEADGGTIFLDEVGELPLDTQARLLRILESGEYQRMGSSEIHKTDVRVVAATNKNLQDAIQAGTFRQDLYYRLAAVTIRVPALRERPEDIHLLFRKFASDVANQYHIPPISVDEGAKQVLLAYRWPGNVRQLLHLVEEISIVEESRTINAETLKTYLPDFESRITSSSSGRKDTYENGFGPGEKAMLYKVIFEMKQQLEELYARTGGVQTNQASHMHSAPHQLTQGGPIITPSPATHPSQVVQMPDTEEFEEQEAIEVPYSTEPSNAGVQPPISGLQTPTSGLQQPASGIQQPFTGVQQPASGIQQPASGAQGHGASSVKTLEQMEKEAIEQALLRNGGNKRKAADELGISERTIHRKIIDYGLA